MTIEWTLEAKKDLRKIYDFHSKYFSPELAHKTQIQAIKKVETLKLGTELGQEEELLKHLKQGHRYLISNHNKIIYKLQNDVVYITHVFDTRQSSRKLKWAQNLLNSTNPNSKNCYR